MILLSSRYTRRRFLGRQPLCGIGVTSLIPVTSIPAAAIERIAVSRPEPGPRTRTSTPRTPCSIAFCAHCSAAICAANGVDFREPLNPTFPAEDHARTLPSESVIETMVLLNELLMCATPVVTFLRSRRRGRRPPGFVVFAITYGPSSFRQPSSSVPYEFWRWCGCAGRVLEVLDGVGFPDMSQSPSCA